MASDIFEAAKGEAPAWLSKVLLGERGRGSRTPPVAVCVVDPALCRAAKSDLKSREPASKALLLHPMVAVGSPAVTPLSIHFSLELMCGHGMAAIAIPSCRCAMR